MQMANERRSMKLFDTEVKQKVSTVIGDIHVEVRMEYRPATMIPDNDPAKITLQMINNRLEYFSGKVSHEVRRMITKAIEGDEDQI
jgi:hypothetical protein